MRLERRVSSALVALVALFVGAQGAIAYVSPAEQEDRIADELVLAEARRLAAYAERGDLDGPRAVDILDRGGDLEAWLVRADGRSVPTALPPALASFEDGRYRSRDGGWPLYVLVTATSAGRLVVAYDAVRNEAQVRQYGLYLAGLFALCVAAAWTVARALARIVGGPLQRLTDRLTDRLAGWAPGAPAGAAVATDEEARLVVAFDRVQGRFEGAIARELAELNGWSLSAAAPPQGGLAFTPAFDAPPPTGDRIDSR